MLGLTQTATKIDGDRKFVSQYETFRSLRRRRNPPCLVNTTEPRPFPFRPHTATVASNGSGPRRELGPGRRCAAPRWPAGGRRGQGPAREARGRPGRAPRRRRRRQPGRDPALLHGRRAGLEGVRCPLTISMQRGAQDCSPARAFPPTPPYAPHKSPAAMPRVAMWRAPLCAAYLSYPHSIVLGSALSLPCAIGP